MGNIKLEEMRGSPRAIPGNYDIPGDISQALISNPTLWQEADRFHSFVGDRGLFEYMRALPNDVRWTMFFVMIARYFEARDLRPLTASEDVVPF